MQQIHPQFITDQAGNKLSVILPINEYNKLMEDLEDAEDIALYDAGKAEDNGERISFDEYIKKRKTKNG